MANLVLSDLQTRLVDRLCLGNTQSSYVSQGLFAASGAHALVNLISMG